ncbi:hypothetical protein LIER_26362 [Lithospermum erythrorhizon]|uniref:Uncharacterized protein n=1 Tax=Lithospermum erythrorhizon TaxID=34254 RepID=A0AAV3R834_LITER
MGEDTQQSPHGLEIMSDEGEPSNMQEVPKSQTAAESGKAPNPSSAESPKSVPEDNVDEDQPVEVEISDDDADVNPSVRPAHPPSEETCHNPDKDDNIVIISSTAGKRRTRATIAAFEKKKEKIGSGGESSNTEKSVDLDELEKMAAEKEMSRKGKRSADGRSGKGDSKKRKGIEIPKKGDDFVVDDMESSGEETKGPGSSKVLRKEDGLGEDAKPLTITNKLMKGKHVVDVDVSASEPTETLPEGSAAELLLKVYEDELKVVEAEIQAKTVRASELRAKIGALRVRVNPSVKTPAGTSSSPM